MLLRDLLGTVAVNLRRLRWRLALTVLGVLVGTSSVLLLLSLGLGVQRALDDSFTQVGVATRIMVQPPDPTAPAPAANTSSMVRHRATPSLDDRAVRRIRMLEGVGAVIGRGDLAIPSFTFGDHQGTPVGAGVRFADFERFGYKLASGRLPTSEHECVVGADVAKNMKPVRPDAPEAAQTPILLDRRLAVSLLAGAGTANAASTDVKVRVVGVLRPMDFETDMSLFFPLGFGADTAAGVASTGSDVPYTSILVRAATPAAVPAVVTSLKDAGYGATSFADQANSLSTAMLLVQLALAGIGGITLFVSALGIANTMTTAILERTREIGIMMALGASLLSVGIAAIANSLLAETVSNATGGTLGQVGLLYIPAWLAVFAVVFAGSIGLLAGTVPAVRASRLSPLQAIRHE